MGMCYGCHWCCTVAASTNGIHNTLVDAEGVPCANRGNALHDHTSDLSATSPALAILAHTVGGRQGFGSRLSRGKFYSKLLRSCAVDLAVVGQCNGSKESNERQRELHRAH